MIRTCELVDVLAGELMMQRRGNPDMGGPSPQDKRNAVKLIERIQAYSQFYLIEVNGVPIEEWARKL